MQIQIRWLLKKQNDLDLHCLQRQGITGFSRTRVKPVCVLAGGGGGLVGVGSADYIVAYEEYS